MAPEFEWVENSSWLRLRCHCDRMLSGICYFVTFARCMLFHDSCRVYVVSWLLSGIRYFVTFARYMLFRDLCQVCVVS
jgi:hypothetical protein